MPARHYTRTLSCPVRTGPDDDPCEATITAEVWPGDPGTHWDPPTGTEVHVLTTQCYHLAILQEEREEHVDALLDQLAEQEQEAYEAAMEARYDEARDREWDNDRADLNHDD